VPALLTLELTCFGAPTARLGDRPPPGDVLWRKHLALLVYLALSPHSSRPRNQILGVLWPEKDEAHARHSLNEAVRRLRISLGPGRLQSEDESISLSTQGLDVDAVRFRALAGSNPSEAIALLRGDFLEGFAVEDAPEFEEWAAGERARFRAGGAQALVAHGEALLGAGRFVAAGEAATRALGLEPYAEPACRLGMRAAALSRDAAGALKSYHTFAERLLQIGERPSRELSELATRIRSARWQHSDGPTLIDEPLLVGRPAALGRIAVTVAEGLTHGPRMLLISGAFGMGKTRLLRYCLERLALEGAVTSRARPLESDQDTPWSTLRALMRAGLLAAPGLPAADPHALGVLAALVPELATRFEPCPPRDRAEVAAALAGLLHALADEAPVGVGVDEAELCDGASLGALSAAIEQLPALPIVVVVASAPREQGVPAELLRLQREVGRGIPGTAVQLDALAAEDLGELVATLAPWCSGEAERDRLTRRLAFETGGNPFVAITLLRALHDVALLREDALAWPPPGATLDSPLPMTAPDLLRRVILARLVQLDAGTKAVITAASIGAVALDLELIGALTAVTGASLDDRLGVLERHRFLVFDRGRYAFAAPLVQQVVRSEGLTPGQAQRLRARAIGILADRRDLESRVLRAELSARATPGPQAFNEAAAVAREALAAQSPRIARRAIRAADRAVASEPAFDRQELEALRARLPG
jgi:DNA-binding SARP family transcriptional activator